MGNSSPSCLIIVMNLLLHIFFKRLFSGLAKRNLCELSPFSGIVGRQASSDRRQIRPPKI